MFDTMTFTKALGAICGSLLVFLLLGWAGSSLYTMGGGHGGEEVAQAYTIDTGAEAPAEEGAAEAEAAAPFADLVAAARETKGEKVFAKCKACHKVDGADITGPHLNGVVGRPVASVGGFAYSDGMVAHGGDWTPEALQEFLTAPKKVVKGTKMTFAGLGKVEDRANLIAYLETQK